MKAVYQLEGVRFAYNREPVLHIDSFAVAENSISALVGPNGSGKSTLLNLLAFINTVNSGEIRFQGEKVVRGNLQECRRQISYVQQKPYLFNFSVLENIELGLKIRGMAKAARLAKATEIASELHILDLLGKRAQALSGGEVQKVAIARALVLKPKVLLLDEPFTHLDRHARKEIEKLLQSLRSSRGQTVIFSTHDQLQAQSLADHICSLAAGRIQPQLHMNLFKGRIVKDKGIFDTGKLKIHIPETITSGKQLAVESTQLVLSKEKLKSSMRNQFLGRITSLQEASGEIHVTVEAAESWHVLITHAALTELDISLGEQIWLSFKSTAVRVF